MKVVGVSSGRASAPHFDEVHPRSELAKLAARADFLMLLVPIPRTPITSSIALSLQR